MKIAGPSINWLIRLTAKEMSGLVMVKQKRLPANYLRTKGSEKSYASYFQYLTLTSIGVSTGVEFSKQAKVIRSLVYLC